MMRIASVVLAVVVGILAGFYGGYRFEQNNASASTSSAQRAAGAGQGGAGGFAACTTPSPRASADAGGRGRGASGTITALDNGTMTVHDQRCNVDVKVTFPSTVIIRKTVSAQPGELQENQQVTVQGQPQSDGSVKANAITILPAGTTFPGRRGQTPAPQG